MCVCERERTIPLKLSVVFIILSEILVSDWSVRQIFENDNCRPGQRCTVNDCSCGKAICFALVLS